jgi:hypothetical protein
MSEEKKKEYFKKNFIQPLTESLPISNEYFSNSYDQYLTANESLANYINFDIKEITNEPNLKSQPEPEHNFQNESEEQIVFGDIILNKHCRNPNFKSDQKVELELDSNTFNKFINENDPFCTYENNYRQVLMFDYLRKFKKSLVPEIWDIPFCLGLLTNEYEFLDENLPDDNFRGLNFTPSINSKSSKNIERLLTTISVKNIFENSIEYFSNSQREVKQAHIQFPENVREDQLPLASDKKEDKKLLEEEKRKQVNAEIQVVIEE